MSWSHAHMFWHLAWLIPFFVGMVWASHTKWRHRMSRILRSTDLKPWNTSSIKTTLSKGISLFVCVLLLIAALARWHWGSAQQDIVETGTTVLIALDLSESMLATDIPPSRLEHAKRKIIDFLELAGGMRVGLIGFAKTAALICPPTSDYEAIRSYLEGLSPDDMPIGGTSIGALIGTSLELIERIAGSQNQSEDLSHTGLIVLTDGEDLDDFAKQSLEKASEKKLVVDVIGMGTESGSPIPLDGGGFKQDENGKTVLTKLNESLLKEMAQTTGGVYVRTGIDNSDVKKMMEHIEARNNKTKIETTTGKKSIPIDRTPWVISAAMFFLVMQFFVGKRALIFVWLGFIYAVFASSIDIRAAPDEINKLDSGSAYRKGVEFYRGQKFKEASEAFARAAQDDDPRIAAPSYFNLGNSEAMNENYDGAIAAYEDALRLKPDFKEAQENLNFVKNLKEQKKSEPSQQNQDKDPNQNQKQPKPNESASPSQSPQASPQQQAVPSNSPQNSPDPTSQNKAQASPVISSTPDPQASPSLSPEDAERMIDQIEDRSQNKKEKEEQKKYEPQKRGHHGQKDW